MGDAGVAMGKMRDTSAGLKVWGGRTLTLTALTLLTRHPRWWVSIELVRLELGIVELVLELVLATVISAWVKPRTFTPAIYPLSHSHPATPRFTHNPRA